MDATGAAAPAMFAVLATSAPNTPAPFRCAGGRALGSGSPSARDARPSVSRLEADARGRSFARNSGVGGSSEGVTDSECADSFSYS